AAVRTRSPTPPRRSPKVPPLPARAKKRPPTSAAPLPSSSALSSPQPTRGGSSVGQSSGLIIRRSLVRVQAAPPSEQSGWRVHGPRGAGDPETLIDGRIRLGETVATRRSEGGAQGKDVSLRVLE